MQIKSRLSGSKYYRPALIAVSALFFAPVLFLILIYFGLFGPVPGSLELSHIRHHEASTIYSSDGEILGSYFYQNRKRVDLDEISPAFIEALRSIEDIRFFEHNGIDARAVARVLVKSLLLGQDAGGGSTLSQQLAKNLYPRDYNGNIGFLADKIREMIIARRLERLYSKEDLLVLYLNSVSFGEETLGLETASQRFFSKHPSELSIHESALLAGLLKAPGSYNPRRFPERALARRNLVFFQMAKYGFITPEDNDSLNALPIDLNYRKLTGSDGPAPYFREHLRAELHGILDTLRTEDGNRYDLYRDGLQIYTTIDSRVQSAAEKAVKKQVESLQDLLDKQIADITLFGPDDPSLMRAWRQTERYRSLLEKGVSEDSIQTILHTPTATTLFSWSGEQKATVSPYDSLRHYHSLMNAGFLAMEPRSGDILAWVGGIDHHHVQYDHVKSRRQAGSAFKPIVYSAAIESGVSPCRYIPNRLTSYVDYEGWTPRNSSNEYGGYYSLQGGLVHSVNTVSVELIMKTGFDPVIETARAMGISSPIPREPSIALGTAEVSLLEMTRAYSTFLNRGRPADPRFLVTVANADGDVIYKTPDARMERSRRLTTADLSADAPAISEQTASRMTSIMSRVVNEGTGYPLRSRFGITRELAGKTGTTQDNRDGWFMGMTPRMVFGAWVGGTNSKVRINGSAGFASQTALPIAGIFLNELDPYPEWNGSSDGSFATHQRDQIAGLTQISDQNGEFTQASFPVIASANSMQCDDYRDDTLGDKLRQLFTGRSADNPVKVTETEDKPTIIDRIRNIFRKQD